VARSNDEGLSPDTTKQRKRKLLEQALLTGVFAGVATSNLLSGALTGRVLDRSGRFITQSNTFGFYCALGMSAFAMLILSPITCFCVYAYFILRSAKLTSG
jgi:hypothetical protein